MKANVYLAKKPKGELLAEEIEFDDLKPNDVEIDVESCGICYSDISMIDNDWGMTTYPIVPGHEIVGKVAAVGPLVKNLKVGATVGLGWFSRSCMTCGECLSGDHNLCIIAEGTIVGRFGGFANKVRADAGWVIPLPDGLDPALAGPLFCGGITVFNPFIQENIKPTDRVGIVGIGGLGHLALQFAKAWGCEVTAFSTTPDKEEEARSMGAHRFAATRDVATFKRHSNYFDLLLCTVHADLDWNSYLSMLRPKGKLHLVGLAPSPLMIPAFSLIPGQRSVTGSPLGSPMTTATMLQFAARHKIAPVVERFKVQNINDAIERVRSGKARYRVVLDF